MSTPFPVLVTDAQTTAALACVRSLGRASYEVHLLGEENQRVPLAFRSRYARHCVLCPPYESPRFAEWVFDYLRTHGIRLILPTERFLHALGTRLPEVLPYLHAPVPLATLQRSLSKYDLFDSFRTGDARLSEHLPRHLFVDFDRPFPTNDELTKLGAPHFLKVDRAHRLDGDSASVIKAKDSEEALRLLESLRGRVRKVLVQGFVPGRGVGAFLLRWRGEIIADFLHLRLHEVPHTGGYSSLRRTHDDERILTDAICRAEALAWEGPAMFEYRQDPLTGDFYLMELNPRFWGSLHLPLYAGVDFPRMLVQLAQGQMVETNRGLRRSKTARLLIPGEIQHIWSLLSDPRVTTLRKVRSLFDFFWLSLSPWVRDDLNFPGDRRVFWGAAFAYAGDLWRGLLRRLSRNQ